MTDSGRGWRAAIERDLIQDRLVLHLARPHDRGWWVLMPDGTFEEQREGEVWTGTGMPLPADALHAIRDAVDQALGRNPDLQVLDAVKESLAVERARIDKVLDRLVGS